MKLRPARIGDKSYFIRSDGDLKMIAEYEISGGKSGKIEIDKFEPWSGSDSVAEWLNPSKIVCVGRNYAAHAAELGNDIPKEPLLFLKAPSAIIGDGEPILLPRQSSRVEHEGEVAIVIGRRASGIEQEDDPLGYVFGYACMNDITARDLQKSDVQFTRGKSFDTFCPIGPVIETEMDASDIEVEVRVNGETRQSGRTSQMIFDIPYLLRYISNQMTLLPGDIIATGTPAGVSTLAEGDSVEVMIEGIGTLQNPVRTKSI